MKYFWKTSFLLGMIGFILLGSSVYWTWSNFEHTTDQKADCAVVFGAAVWKGDIPSHALYDRTVAGLNLYQTGQVQCLIFSGGKSKIGSHEVDVMKKLALEVNIPEDKIILDYEGVNTIATVKNLKKISSSTLPLSNSAPPSFILVSNDFHLGRIRLLAWKFLDNRAYLYKAKYNYGTYGRQKYSFWREVAGTLYYGLLAW